MWEKQVAAGTVAVPGLCPLMLAGDRIKTNFTLALPRLAAEIPPQVNSFIFPARGKRFATTPMFSCPQYLVLGLLLFRQDGLSIS